MLGSPGPGSDCGIDCVCDEGVCAVEVFCPDGGGEIGERNGAGLLLVGDKGASKESTAAVVSGWFSVL